MPKTLPLSEVKARLPELVAGVEEREEEVVVTKNGRPAAILVNVQEYARLKETIDVLSDPALMNQIAESKAFYRTGNPCEKAPHCVTSLRPDVPPHVAEVIRSFRPDLKRSGKSAVRAIAADPECGEPLLRELDGLWKYRVRRFRSVCYRSEGAHYPPDGRRPARVHLRGIDVTTAAQTLRWLHKLFEAREVLPLIYIRWSLDPFQR